MMELKLKMDSSVNSKKNQMSGARSISMLKKKQLIARTCHNKDKKVRLKILKFVAKFESAMNKLGFILGFAVVPSNILLKLIL